MAGITLSGNTISQLLLLRTPNVSLAYVLILLIFPVIAGRPTRK